MMQRQMLGIRERAQRTAVVAPLAASTERPTRTKTNGHAADRPDKTEVVATAT